jgi:hypothetical protein
MVTLPWQADAIAQRIVVAAGLSHHFRVALIEIVAA